LGASVKTAFILYCFDIKIEAFETKAIPAKPKEQEIIKSCARHKIGILK